MLENWGFDQGGEIGFRQGNFVGDDTELILTKMSLNQGENRLAVAGAHGTNWAVRIYDLSTGQPEALVSWTGGLDLNHSIVSSLAWVKESGKLMICVEHFDGDEGNAMTLVKLDPNEKNVNLPTFLLNGWTKVAEIKKNESQTDSISILGVKKGKVIVQEFDTINMKLKPGAITAEEVIEANSFIEDENQIWIAGKNSNGQAVLEAVGVDFKKFGKGSTISAIAKSGSKIYMTGTEILGNSFENIFLKCVELKDKRTINFVWEIASRRTIRAREWGGRLLPMPEGGVIMCGNFRKPWLLGQNERRDNVSKQFAVLTSAGDEENFESFLARYDESGNLEWAQTSGMTGNDFYLDLASLGTNFTLFLGNRNIGGGFGPYLSKVRVDGNPEINCEIIDNIENQGEPKNIFWDSPVSIRFGEPITSSTLSARAVGGGDFIYELNGQETAVGDFPFFTPGELTINAKLMRSGVEVNATTMKIEGKKGRVFLKAGYDELSVNEIQLWAQLHGIASNVKDNLDESKLIEKVRFESLNGQPIEGGRVSWNDDFNGMLEVLAVFEGGEFFESATRTISMLINNGKLDESENSGVASVRVHDLNGWQNTRSAPLGSEVEISATQGFGKQRKFDRWVEFSEESDTLRTARVQDPFNLRSTLIVESDTTLFAKYKFSFVGTAVNGYLHGAKVFLDVNLNGLYEESEPFGYTDENGQFTIDFGESDADLIDKNEDGQIDYTEATLVAVGGMDTASSLAMEVSFRAPPNYSVISSVTTLVSELTNSGIDLEESEEIVSSVLNLPPAIDLSSFEPLGAVLTESELSKMAVLRSTQLANLYNEGARYIETATGSEVNRIRAGEIIVESLSTFLIENAINENYETFDLADKETLLSVVDEAVELAEKEKEDGFIQNLNNDISSLSARTRLSITQPEIAQIGNDLMAERMIENVVVANLTLEELSIDPSLEATDFKSFASALQTGLNDLGGLVTSTLLNEEVTAIQSLQGDELGEGLSVLAEAAQIKSVDEFVDEPNEEQTKVFNFHSLSDKTKLSKANIFAPVLGVVRISAPAKLQNNQVIGTFAAFDPEGSKVAYSFVDGNPDLDEDGTPLLAIEENTGRVSILDSDDLSLLRFTFVEPMLRVNDESNLFVDHPVRVDLSRLIYQEGRPHLSIKVLEINENQPLGTQIGKLQVLGKSGEPLSGNPKFQLLEIEGDNDSLNRRSVGPALLLEPDGSLRTGRILDFEDKPSYLLRMRITDENGLFMETSVEVKVIDQFRPVVKTLDGLGENKDFDPVVIVEEIPLLKQNSIINAGTPIARLKGMFGENDDLFVPHEFFMLDEDKNRNHSSPTSSGEWISLTPILEEKEVHSDSENKDISLVLDNLVVDKEKAPTWLTESRGAVWFALVKRSFTGRIEELFSSFDTSYIFGYASPVFSHEEGETIFGNRFIAFPSDLIRRGNGSSWAADQLFSTSSQIMKTGALQEWLGQDQLDLAVYVEDFSAETKRSFEKRFPIGPTSDDTDLIPNLRSDMLTLGTDGTLLTTGLVDFSKPIAWSFDARMSGFDLGYKDYSVRIEIAEHDKNRLEIQPIGAVTKDSGMLRIMGKLLDHVDGDKTTDVGFIVSSNPSSKLSDPNAEVIAVEAENGAFEYFLPLNIKYHNKYYRAYALNGEGVSYGVSNRIKVPESLLSMNWTDSELLPEFDGWWSSPWLGEFYRINDSDWIFHAELGWVYMVVRNQAGGLWIWQERLGWLWTNAKLYPFLYKEESGQWLFFHGRARGHLILFDYDASEWVKLEN